MFKENKEIQVGFISKTSVYCDEQTQGPRRLGQARDGRDQPSESSRDSKSWSDSNFKPTDYSGGVNMQETEDWGTSAINWHGEGWKSGTEKQVLGFF